ncbi:MAG: hypothetical protein QF464_17855, partial [Myxococcota bacterium]|nr:hypothetical protein [Myxococcota bacterium]
MVLLVCGSLLACESGADTGTADGVTDTAAQPDTVAVEDTSVSEIDSVAVVDAVAVDGAGAELLDGGDVSSSDADHDVTAGEQALVSLFPPLATLLVPAPEHFFQARMSEVVLDEDGESDDLFVELPEETTSVFVMVEGEESAFLTLKKAITPPPLSESIVKGPGEHVCVPCKNRVVSAQHIGSFLLPNDPSVEVKGGEWVFKVRGTHRVEDLSQG